MILTKKQEAAINALVKAKKDLEKSGLQIALVDEQIMLFSAQAELSFENVNTLDSFKVNKMGFINSYGL